MSRGEQAAGGDAHAAGSGGAVQQDPLWPAFLQSLKEKGFFRGELDGSQLHRALMKVAEAFFTDMKCKKEEQEVDNSSLAPAAQIRKILNSVPCEEKEFKDAESSLEPPDGQCLQELEWYYYLHAACRQLCKWLLLAVPPFCCTPQCR